MGAALGGAPIDDSASLRQSWRILVVLTVSTIGCYYIFDSLQPIVETLHKENGLLHFRIALLNGAFSIGSMIPVLVAGVLVDRFGTKRFSGVFGLVCVLGPIVMLLSVPIQTLRFPLLLSGRFICGLGVEAILITVTAVLSVQFPRHLIGFAQGINLSFARMGSIFAVLSGSHNEIRSFSLMTVAGVVCLSGALLYGRLESPVHQVSHGDIDRLSFPHIQRFNRVFWILTFAGATFYAAFSAFALFIQSWFQEILRLGDREAANASAVMLGVSAVVAPFLGKLASNNYRTRHLMTLGCITLVIGMGLLRSNVLGVYFPISLLGVAFAIFPAGFWPHIAFITSMSIRATAYALFTLVQYAAIGIWTIVFGKLHDLHPGSLIETPKDERAVLACAILAMVAAGGVLLAGKWERSDLAKLEQ